MTMSGRHSACVTWVGWPNKTAETLRRLDFEQSPFRLVRRARREGNRREKKKLKIGRARSWGEKHLPPGSRAGIFCVTHGGLIAFRSTD